MVPSRFRHQGVSSRRHNEVTSEHTHTLGPSRRRCQLAQDYRLQAPKRDVLCLLHSPNLIPKSHPDR